MRSMTSLAYLAACTAGFLTLAVNSPAATVSFDALTQGTFQTPGGGPIISVHVAHPTVSATPFKFASLVAEQTVDLSSLPMTSAATFTFTNASGEKLFGTYQGVGAPGTNQGELFIDGPFSFAGGTGSFAGASGGGLLHAAIQSTGTNDGVSTVTWKGSLSGTNIPPASPATPTFTFDAVTQGTAHSIGAGPVMAVHIDHPSVSASPFVFTSLVSEETADLGSGLDAATFTFSTADGQKLFGTYQSTLTPGANASELICHADFLFSGGTGPFAGASGGGTAQADIQFIGPSDAISSIVWKGTLTGTNLPPTTRLDMQMVPMLTLTGEIGSSHQIQYTTDLSQTTNWTVLKDVVLSNTAEVLFDTGASREVKRFYRAIPK